MLTNHYLLPYKERKKSISQFELNILKQDENYKLNLERPLASNQIKNINQNKIYLFIDDIMCNNKVNTLLYSSCAKKEESFYLKQKKSLLKVIPLKNGVGYLAGGGKKTVKSFSKKRMQEKMYEKIKKHIENYKISRNKSMILLNNKNNEFIKSQPKIEKKLSKLYYKPINELRLKGYQKALNKCLNLSTSEKNFNMPDIELNTNDVYSRLYNNYILNNKNLKKKKKNCNDSSEYINREGIKNNNDFIFSYKSLNNSRNNLKRKLNKKYNNSAERLNGKKLIKFKLKSNISNLDNNKQFTMTITPNLIDKCFSSISGGPKNIKKEEIKNSDVFNIKKKFNYKILSLNNNLGEKKDISLFNTMIINDPNLDDKYIQNKNYRDTENDSNLHIAVKYNSIELVKYFLNKNYDINQINKNGQTPLHLACELGYENIINLLIKRGADLNIKDIKGRKPLEILSKSKRS